MDSFHGSNWFSQVDLASGYWGVELHKNNRHKTAFAAPGGKYELTRMPFGLCNAQATFQDKMDAIVAEVQEQGHLGVAAFVDNIVVFTKTFDEHIATLNALFERLDRANLSLRKDKCEFPKKSIKFLGFIVNGKTVRPSKDIIDKASLFPVPKTRRQLQRFLGLANLNRRFVSNYSVSCAPLNPLTSSKVSFCWKNNHQEAFEKIKKQLSEGPGLMLPEWDNGVSY